MGEGDGRPEHLTGGGCIFDEAMAEAHLGMSLSETDQVDGETGAVTGYSCSALLQPANYCYWGIRPLLKKSK